MGEVSALKTRYTMSFWNKFFDYVCGYRYHFNEREHIDENAVHTVDVEEYLDTRNLDSPVSFSVELEPSSQEPNRKLPHIGVVCTFLASLLFAISNLIVKKLKYPAPKLQFYKFIISNISMAPFFIGTICYRRTNAFKIPSKSPYLIALLLIQGVVGACLATFVPCGVEYLSIPDSTFIVSGLPMFINFFVFIFTVEKNFGKVFCLTIGLAIGGIGCLYEAEGLCCSEALSKGGFMISFGSTLLLMIYLAILLCLKEVHPAMINFCFTVGGLLVSFVICATNHELEIPSNIKEEAGIILAALFVNFVAHGIVLLAIRHKPARVVVCIRTTEPIFSFAMQTIFLGDSSDVYRPLFCIANSNSIGGSGLFLVAVGITIMKEFFLSLPNEQYHGALAQFPDPQRTPNTNNLENTSF